MRNTEFVNLVLKHLRNGKKQIEIAKLTGRHYNTIYKYVKYIRNNLVRNPEEIVNKIDSKLDEELEVMSHKDLITYRRILTPQKAEIEHKSRTEIKHEISFILSELPEDEREFCRRIARTYIKRNNQARPDSIH